MTRNGYDITTKNGHFVVLDDNGDFVCSADSYREAMEEAQQLENDYYYNLVANCNA